MKNYLILIGLFAVLLLAIPTIVIAVTEPEEQAAFSLEIEDLETVRYLDLQSEEVLEISMRDYLIGCVLAQMPADFEPEALKAQTVLAHTYIIKRHLQEESDPTAELNGADLSSDTTQYQSYFSQEDAQNFYGEDYEAGYKQVAAAVDAAMPYICTYQGEPIITAFHAISGGTTESAAVAWGTEVPYLVSVDSAEDLKISGSSSTLQFTAEELSARLSQSFPEVDLSGEPSGWITITEKSEIGTVLWLTAGKTAFSISGTDFAVCLNLPSQRFTVTYEEDSEIFVFSVKGSGHQVGMSQFGANAMAQEGKTFQEILAHYFAGTTIQRL